MTTQWSRWGMRFAAFPTGTDTKIFGRLRTRGSRAPGGAWQARDWQGRWITMGERVQLVGYARTGVVQGGDARGRVTVRWDDGATTIVPGRSLRPQHAPARHQPTPSRQTPPAAPVWRPTGVTPPPPPRPAAPAVAPPVRPPQPHQPPSRLDDLIPRHGEPNPDEATLKAALAHLLEGRTYGNGYTVRVYEALAGTHTPHSGGGRYVRFTVAVKAPDGGPAGISTRKLVREPDGTLVADHELQRLLPEHRGNGFGSAWGHHMETLYRDSGFDRVELFAADDDGGYMWASAGYDFNSEWSATAILDELADELTRLEHARDTWPGPPDDPMLQQIIDDIAAARALLADAAAGYGQPGFPSAYRISQAGRRPGMKYRRDEWLGSRVMAGSEWEGVLKL
ncbi:hypothetical protein [Planomonospora sp. ID82291]|uniref:hypothetical protein n=1 Tax=Planomonospora sp. ID82291 TaxID=2738136 RepID=UPI0018C3AA58|nr:hypothetical protein [Planomonospora sp. ID82291]MBG0818769.1 hypothetical protein [Planomonospora sp. ID82291]